MITARIRKIIEYKGISTRKFCEKVGIANGFLDKVKDVGSEKLLKILNAYPEISPEWLLTGRGSMLKMDQPDMDMQYTRQSKAAEKVVEMQEVPLYDLDASAGLGLLLSNKDQFIIDKIRIPRITRCDGAVFVTGDSMYPLLKSGDIVLFRQIKNISYMPFGDIYILSYEIDGDEHLVVKYVQKSDKEGHIRLVSYNPHHDPLDIPVSAVTSIAVVLASIRYNSML